MTADEFQSLVTTNHTNGCDLVPTSGKMAAREGKDGEHDQVQHCPHQHEWWHGEHCHWDGDMGDISCVWWARIATLRDVQRVHMWDMSAASQVCLHRFNCVVSWNFLLHYHGSPCDAACCVCHSNDQVEQYCSICGANLHHLRRKHFYLQWDVVAWLEWGCTYHFPVLCSYVLWCFIGSHEMSCGNGCLAGIYGNKIAYQILDYGVLKAEILSQSTL